MPGQRPPSSFRRSALRASPVRAVSRRLRPGAGQNPESPRPPAPTAPGALVGFTRPPRHGKRPTTAHPVLPWLFANRGEFRTGDLDEMMNKASCLSLLSNAVLVWNTVRIAEIVSRLRVSGEEILDNDLARVSPLCRAHIIPTGTYSFDPEMPGVNAAYNTLP